MKYLLLLPLFAANITVAMQLPSNLDAAISDCVQQYDDYSFRMNCIKKAINIEFQRKQERKECRRQCDQKRVTFIKQIPEHAKEWGSFPSAQLVFSEKMHEKAKKDYLDCISQCEEKGQIKG